MRPELSCLRGNTVMSDSKRPIHTSLIPVHSDFKLTSVHFDIWHYFLWHCVAYHNDADVPWRATQAYHGLWCSAGCNMPHYHYRVILSRAVGHADLVSGARPGFISRTACKITCLCTAVTICAPWLTSRQTTSDQRRFVLSTSCGHVRTVSPLRQRLPKKMRYDQRRRQALACKGQSHAKCRSLPPTTVKQTDEESYVS